MQRGGECGEARERHHPRPSLASHRYGSASPRGNRCARWQRRVLGGDDVQIDTGQASLQLANYGTANQFCPAGSLRRSDDQLRSVLARGERSENSRHVVADDFAVRAAECHHQGPVSLQ